MMSTVARNAWNISIVCVALCGAGGAVADSYDDALTAVRMDDIPALEALFSRGLDANTTDSSANTLLMLAIRDDHVEMAKNILGRRPNLAARNRYGETALMFASANCHLDLVNLLVAKGAAVNLSGWNPLSYAAWKGRIEVAKYLLERGADVDAVSSNGISALMMAARGGHYEMVKLLLWEVADPNLRTDTGETALDWAEKAGNTEIAELLKQAGAEK